MQGPAADAGRGEDDAGAGDGDPRPPHPLPRHHRLLHLPDLPHVRSLSLWLVGPLEGGWRDCRGGWVGPVLCYAFFLLSTAANKLLLSPFVRLVARQEAREGDFRFKHVSVRSNAEAIAFYDAADTERKLADRRLADLVATQHHLIVRRFFIKRTPPFIP